ncbi:unnamed protein product [Kluyveromyces dobzhanskii CBS 2104]|uniref:WGS project CCBQ000000000 data, contig 00058 n=1 Tax=Kluyveromyces dobzhanskii CBS 2104 TaxID=1427455 RepID=A0A0A8LBD6_9SACH|nr:unnamed protein product [Kluyveromyces dobzhanskii CBS 2104]
MRESRKGLTKQEHVANGRGERSPELRRNVELLSSPLKDNDIIIDSQASDILKENDVNVQGSQRLGYGKVKRVRSPKKTTIWSQYSNKTEKENVKRAKVLVDFNVNPLTKKPWIFEDFKINESIPSKNRGRSGKNSSRVARFHAQAGSPVKDKQKIVLNSDGLLETVDDIGLRHPNVPDLQYPDDSFENLRDRSKSPPGYGRLNFPTTQELIEDKEESKKLLFKKTKERFLQATNNSIPISDREYYFRNAKLNDIVDDGTFAWNDSELNIFTR